MWAAVTKGLECRANIVIDRGRSLATSLIHTFEHQTEYEDMFITPQEAMDLCTQRSLLIVVDTHSMTFVESQEVLKAIPRVVVAILENFQGGVPDVLGRYGAPAEIRA